VCVCVCAHTHIHIHTYTYILIIIQHENNNITRPRWAQSNPGLHGLKTHSQSQQVLSFSVSKSLWTILGTFLVMGTLLSWSQSWSSLSFLKTVLFCVEHIDPK